MLILENTEFGINSKQQNEININRERGVLRVGRISVKFDRKDSVFHLEVSTQGTRQSRIRIRTRTMGCDVMPAEGEKGANACNRHTVS